MLDPWREPEEEVGPAWNRRPCLPAASCPPPPSAQGSFAHPRGVTPPRHRLGDHVEERYPLVIARTDPCVRPNPSCLLGHSSADPVFAGCCQPLLREMAVPTLSLRPLRRRSDPYPAASPRYARPLLHGEQRPHPTGKRFGAPVFPHKQLRWGAVVEVAVIRLPWGSYARSASRLLRRASSDAGPPGLAHHASPGWLPYPGCGVASCPTWTTDVAGSHQLGRSLVGCSFPHTAYR